MKRIANMFKKKLQPLKDPLEERLDIISDLTRDLERKEFNSLMDAIKAMFEARQKLKSVKTNEEKEFAEINEVEKTNYIEVEK